MIFVDTSIWVAYFRGDDSSTTHQLNEHLDEGRVALAAPVWVEILSSASKKDIQTLKIVLSALPKFYPQKSTWKLLQTWVETARAKGQRFGMADLLIAGITFENNGFLWSLDSDFSRMSKLKFVKVI